jgi:exopolysaccharide production protein ExoZ
LVARNRGLLLLGAASYAIYLTHFFVIGFVMRLGKALHMNEILMATVVFAVSILALTLVGIGTHLVIERPLGQWCKAIPSWKRIVARATA